MSFRNHCRLLKRIASGSGHHHHHHHAIRRHLSCLSKASQIESFKWDGRRRHQTTTVQVLRPYVDPKLSYAFGRSHEHLIYSTVARELDRQVRAKPDEVAFISHYEGISVTFKQFDEDINRLAKSLVTKFGIGKGDFVGVYAYNCYNWLLIQYACSRVGAILTPINPSYKAHELAYILERGKIKCLFMPGFRSEQAELNNHQQVISSQVILDLWCSRVNEKPLLESIILLDGTRDGGGNKYAREDVEQKYPLARYCKFYDWHEATQQTDGRVFRSAREADEAGVHSPEDACILSPELVSPDDLFAVYYTSGTTGKPKGACVSQFTVVNNVNMCQVRVRHGRPRNWKCVAATTLPMFHIFAGVLTALSPIMANSTVILASYKYDIAAYAESIIKHGANFTTLTPTMLIDLLTYVERHPELGEMPLKAVQPGGAMLPPELVARAFRLLPHLEEVRTGYGSTENGAVATFQTIHEPDPTRAATVGPPMDFTEVRIVSPDSCLAGGDGLALPLGERGEIQTRGYNTMVEYLNEPAKTREVLTANRWYRTGDIGFMHPHGSIVVSGRSKHMLIKGGENIYPEEVEQMMHEMECIEKVHVVGVPDKRFGEQVCAWVKLQPNYVGAGGDYHELKVDGQDAEAATDKQQVVTKEQILQFCKERMTYFKVPKYLFFVHDFPMTPTKKVQNHKMVEQSIEILKLDGQ